LQTSLDYLRSKEKKEKKSDYFTFLCSLVQPS